MVDLSNQEIQVAVTQLDQAIYSHEQWCNNLQRVLIARLPPDEGDLAADAAGRCRFGRWYDSEDAEPLRENPAFAAIGEAHGQMHESARGLLQRSADGLAISPGDYDQFNKLLDRMRLEIVGLRRELAELIQNRDPLTGTRNRTSLLSDLREQQALVRRGLQESAIVMIDLDHFKDTNDQHGHLAGDAVLIAASESITRHLRPYDRLYRYGGEEFLLLIQGAPAVAASVAERLRATVSEQGVENPAGGPPLHITASFGVAVLDATNPVEDSIDRADKAMYQAKAGGRDRVEIAP